MIPTPLKNYNCRKIMYITDTCLGFANAGNTVRVVTGHEFLSLVKVKTTYKLYGRKELE